MTEDVFDLVTAATMVQRIREVMTIRFQKQEVGSWKLDLVNFVHWFRKRFVDLGTEKAPGTKLAKSNFQLPTSNFLFLKTEDHVFSNPLYNTYFILNHS